LRKDKGAGVKNLQKMGYEEKENKGQINKKDSSISVFSFNLLAFRQL
jgi:hypothetical protein